MPVPALQAATRRAGEFAGVSYEDFWRRYLAAHADRRTRALHYFGTVLAIVMLAAAISAGDWPWLAIVPVVGYAPAWVGHALFERNRPETFSHPAWSLVSDFRMLLLFSVGRLGGELRRLGIGGA
jgi:hypothetical protein